MKLLPYVQRQRKLKELQYGWSARVLLPVLVLTLILHRETYAQQLLAEIHCKTRVQSLQGAMVGDSLFLRFKDEISSFNTNYTNCFVMPDGAIKLIDLNEVEKSHLCGMVDHGDELYIYYFDQNRKSITVKAVTINKTTGNKTILENQLDLPGKVLGSYVENGLNLICASKNDFRINVLRIDKLTITNQKSFSISYDLVADNKSRIAFIDSDRTVSPAQAITPIKLFKAGQKLVLTVDSPYSRFNGDSHIHQTSVISMDLNDLSTVIKVFYFNGQGLFTSYYFAGRLYRINYPRQTNLEIFDIHAGKLLFSKELFTKKTIGDTCVLRKTSNLRIFRKPGSLLMRPGAANFILVQSAHSAPVITLGSRAEAGGSVPLVIGLGPAVFFTAALSAIAFNELIEGPYLELYAHFSDPVEGGSFEYLASSGLVTELIDRYELGQLAQRIDYFVKAYITGNDVVYGVYQERDARKLQVRKFTKPETITP